MKKQVASFAFVAAAALTLTACGSGSQHADAETSGTDNEGQIVFGVSNGYPPMEYTDPDTGEFTGFDVELGEAIGEKLGLEVTWEEMEFDQLINSLRTDRVDATMSGMSDTEERQESIDFVDYVKDGGQFFTSSSLSKEFGSPDDLCGQALGTVSGTTYVDRVETWSEENCDASEQIEVLRIPEASEVLLQLRQDRIVAGMLGTVSLAYQRAQDEDLVLMGEPVSEDFYGIGVQKGNAELAEDVQTALDELKEEGVYDELLQKYKLDDYGVDEFTFNLGAGL